MTEYPVTGSAYLRIAPAISGRTDIMVMHPGRQVTLPITDSARRRTYWPNVYYFGVSDVSLRVRTRIYVLEAFGTSSTLPTRVRLPIPQGRVRKPQLHSHRV